MATQILNLVIPQGTTLELPFIQRHLLQLSKDLAPSPADPPTTISIKPMPIDLPAGQQLVFADPAGGCDDVKIVTTAIIPAGSTEAMIASYTGTKQLRCGSSAPTLPRDITGQMWSAAAKVNYHGQKLLEFSFAANPLIGLVTMTASHIATAQLTANCRYDQLPVSPKDWQKKTSFDPKIWDKGYYWDAEYEQSGRITRVLQGRLFVPAEATT